MNKQSINHLVGLLMLHYSYLAALPQPYCLGDATALVTRTTTVDTTAKEQVEL
jgi:hypothetical protein